MNFDYTKKTNKGFDQVVADLQEEVARAGFKVLHVHDFQKTLQGKGFTIEPFKAVEICNAKAAHTVLSADLKIGLMLPCKINVYQKDSQVYVSGLRPTVLPRFFPKANLGSLPTEIDLKIKSIINKAIS